MTSESREDYLRAIFMLSVRKNRSIKTKELAQELNVSSASVTEMVSKLAEGGLVDVERYHGFSLTRKGLAEALKVMRKHRLLERFLTDTLGLPKGEVHAEAHRLEHVVSEDALDKIDKLLKRPRSCPHDSRIPKKKSRVMRMDELSSGQKARIVFSRLKDSEALNRLSSMGLVPEASVEMIGGLRKGPIMMRIKDSKIALDREIASRFYVEL